MAGNLEEYIRTSSKLKIGIIEDDYTLKTDLCSQKSRKTTGEAAESGQTKAGKQKTKICI